MSFFEVKNVSAGYGVKKIVDGVSFDVEVGQLVGLLGANGSGKTTLLKAICNILPHEGQSILRVSETKDTGNNRSNKTSITGSGTAGNDLQSQSDTYILESLKAKELARICSYIPQRSGVSIDISALDVVLMGFNPYLGLLEHPNQRMREAAKAALRQVGLEGKEDVNYLHLSEGQKQLCILARTLVAKCSLLLLDEPESALDFRYRYRMLEILHDWLRMEKQSAESSNRKEEHLGIGSELHKERGAVVALHDPSLALNFCDKLILLADGKVMAEIFPQWDSLEEMEQKLKLIYGPVSLQRCVNKAGASQLVMLKEPEVL